MGLMVLLGKPLTLVSSSLPMLLVALGSAYGIHLLVRYFKLLEDSPPGTDRKELVRETVRQTGIPVIMAGVTTIVGFSSFLVMDTQPLREFGLMMAMGVLISLVMSLVFIPAVLSRFDMGRMRMGRQSERVPEILLAIARKATVHPAIVLVLFGLVMAGSLYGMTRITTHTSLRSYFSKKSEPIRADDFMVGKFGGSIFIQLFVEGDLRNPLVLKEMEKLEYVILGMKDVSDLQSATTIITMANAAMMGRRQIPDTRDQVETLAFMAEDDPSVRLLVDKEWSSALSQIRIGGFDLERAYSMAREIESVIGVDGYGRLVEIDLSSVEDASLRDRLGNGARKDAAQRLDLFLTSRRVGHAGVDSIAGAIDSVWKDASVRETEEFRAGVEEVLTLNIIEDELVYLRDEEADWDSLVDDLVAGFADGRLDEKEVYGILYSYSSDEEHVLEDKALQKRKEKGGSEPTGFQKAASTIRQGIEDVQRSAIAVAVLSRVVSGKLPDRSTTDFRIMRDRADEFMAYLYSGKVILPEKESPQGVTRSTVAKFDVKVTGYPLLYQEMNKSVIDNQIKSSVTALAILFVLLAGLFRSIRIGIVSLVPCVTTLVVTFGVLGALGQPMDIGISMISIIAMGASVDYPIHFIWKYWEVADRGFLGGLRETMFTTGRAVFANTFEVMFGFSILMAASLIPIRKSGGLIAETLLLAGIGTLFLMPVFLKFAHEKVYRPLEPGVSGTERGTESSGGSGQARSEK